MFEKNLKEFTLNETVYPYKCDMVVLEKIQTEVGDLVEAEDKLRGFVPKIDADGVYDRTTGRFTLPDVKLVCQCLIWMIEEGIEIAESDIKPPTEKELKQQDEYTINGLALIAFTEFEECVAGKKSPKKRESPKK